MKQLHQVGDTIVEVLLATAVIGFAIGGSYTIATRSLRGARQAQEHSEALKIIEGQAELLKNYTRAVPTPGGTSIFSSTPKPVFCMDGSTTQRVNTTKNNIPTLSSDNWSTYPAACQKGLYHYAVQVTDLGTFGSTTVHRYQFKIVVRWDSIGKSSRDEEVIEYRLNNG